MRPSAGASVPPPEYAGVPQAGTTNAPSLRRRPRLAGGKVGIAPWRFPLFHGQQLRFPLPSPSRPPNKGKAVARCGNVEIAAAISKGGGNGWKTALGFPPFPRPGISTALRRERRRACCHCGPITVARQRWDARSARGCRRGTWRAVPPCAHPSGAPPPGRSACAPGPPAGPA